MAIKLFELEEQLMMVNFGDKFPEFVKTGLIGKVNTPLRNLKN